MEYEDDEPLNVEAEREEEHEEYMSPSVVKFTKKSSTRAYHWRTFEMGGLEEYMAGKPKISAKVKYPHVQSHNPLNLQTNSSKFHPRTTAARICTLASSFCHPDNINDKAHKQIIYKAHQSSKLDATQSIKERATQPTSITSYHQPPIHPHSSLQLDRDLINEEGNANETGYELDHIEHETDRVHSDPTDLRHGTSEIKKRTRGPTTDIGWSQRKYHCTEKVEVQIPADLRRIVGERSQELITRSGRIVRLYAPLNVEKWAHIPIDIIDKIIQIIYSEFKLPNENHVIDDLITSLRRIYNVWRSRLRSDHYLKWSTDAQRRDHCPKDINPDQWSWLIDYWGSAKFKKISDVNKKNRSQQKMKSHVGTKSIARTIHELRQVAHEDQQLPLYLRLWEKTRKGKQNQWTDEAAEEVYNKLLELHEEQKRDKGEDKLTTEEAYTIVLGKRSSYIPGMGPGPKPLDRESTNVQRLRAQIRAEVEAKMTTRIQEMEERVAQREARMEKLEARMMAFIEQREPEDQMDSTS